MKLFSFLVFLSFVIASTSTVREFNTTHKHYIVYMGEHSYPDTVSVINSNYEMLSSVVGSVDEAKKAAVHHYSKTFRGFSARLTPEQADKISKHESVISIFESTVHPLHTTRSWEFMEDSSMSNFAGRYNKIRKSSKYDVIVGRFDSGVWPESLSFNPHGLSPVPKYFRGECVTGPGFERFHCNRKLIGARYYLDGFIADLGAPELYAPATIYQSPRDDYGHGTHTASTAAGSDVNLANVRGWDSNTAKGGAPLARLAVYKVCWQNSCSCADILKAFDDAIHDGVDIITMSMGAAELPLQAYIDDCFSIGSLFAFKNGILVSSAAGNFGGAGAVVNVAPWLLTVAASTTDRESFCQLRLGYDETVFVKGNGYNLHYLKGQHEIVAAFFAGSSGVSNEQARDTLNPLLIRGKIVVCVMNTWKDNALDKSTLVKELGGVGMVLLAVGAPDTLIYNFDVPTSVISDDEEERTLDAYMRSTTRPVASILGNSDEVHRIRSPQMASFSSKGPNSLSKEIIKPDITAPGVNILAALPPSDGEHANSAVYGMDSGTSMACPHASGVAATIKAINRDWSPAAIKSALMTTASIKDNMGLPIQSNGRDATPLDFGSGHLNPDSAIDPGLVYDYDMDDLVDFLCSQNINELQLQNLIGKKVTCKFPPVPDHNLNYPSIGISNMDGPLSVYRTLTFVGNDKDPKLYRVYIESPPGVNVKVVPDTLDFSESKKLQFRVDFEPYGFNGHTYGSITWIDGNDHTVRSPISINL